jgi:hypothetical protein
MIGTALGVQASVWKHCRVVRRGDVDLAVLLMEGEAEDRTNGGGLAEDALHRVALSRGLALATDLDHLDLRPVLGWRVAVDQAGAVTLEWPHLHPLLSAAPLDLPPGWLAAAVQQRLVVVVAGYGLSLLHPAADVLAARLARAAREGALAAGAVDCVT